MSIKKKPLESGLKIPRAYINVGGHLYKDYSVSLIRLVALVFIVLCHFMQYYDNKLAWWFNVGTQIFICISGYLYGMKDISDVTCFYRKRLEKILLPYYITLICAGIAIFILARNQFSIASFVKAIFLQATIAGGGHLWFVKLILVCYLITPLLNAYKHKYVKNRRTLLLFVVIGCFVIMSVFVPYSSSDSLNPAWIVCYVIGYALGINKRERYISFKIISITICCVALISNFLQIYLTYITPIQLEGVMGVIFRRYKDYSHVVLGVSIFLLIKAIYPIISRIPRINRLLDCSDKYSYEIYLVHQFFILGPLSILAIFNEWFIGWPLVVILIMLSAFSLKFIANVLREVPVKFKNRKMK